MIKGERVYVYDAELVRVVDGDTLYFNLDLGLRIHHDIRVRLLDVDAPEIRGSEKPMGLQVKRLVDEFLEKWKDLPLKVETHKTGKYGRWLGVIWVGDINLNELIVAWSKEARKMTFD